MRRPLVSVAPAARIAVDDGPRVRLGLAELGRTSQVAMQTQLKPSSLRKPFQGTGQAVRPPTTVFPRSLGAQVKASPLWPSAPPTDQGTATVAESAPLQRVRPTPVAQRTTSGLARRIAASLHARPTGSQLKGAVEPRPEATGATARRKGAAGPLVPP